MRNIKGIILAGGTGGRLSPITKAISKQLLPIYDKPMIYYPLTTLMLAGIKDILIITTPNDKEQYIRLLGDGSQLGINITFETQERPEGIAQAFIIGKNFINKSNVMLILGDNLFHGDKFSDEMKTSQIKQGASIFVYKVSDPEDMELLILTRMEKFIVLKKNLKPK